MGKTPSDIDPITGPYVSTEGRGSGTTLQTNQITNIGDQEERRSKLRDRRLVYENDWDDLLTEELDRQFVPETAKNIKLMLDTSQNVFRRIVREICTVYKRPSVRELVRNDVTVESPRWDELVESLKLQWMLGEAHRLSKACTACFVRVHYVETKDKLILELIPPDYIQVDLDPDDPMEMTGCGFRVARKDRSGRNVEAWIYYTPEKLYFLDSTGVPIKNPFKGEPEESEAENPYGIIPIVPFHATAPTKSFWRPNWNKDAYRANILIGVLLTYMNFLVKTQSFKQLYFSADSVSPDMLNAVLDPLFPLPLPSGTTAGTLDLNTRLEAIDSTIRNKVTAIANNYGISPENFSVSGNIQSGYGLRVANRALEEIRDADKVLAENVEQQLFRVIRTVNNVSGGQRIPEDVELRWNPGEISYPPSWEEEEAQWTFEMDHGIANQVDYLLSKDPDLTREEAIERLVMIREENDQIKPRLNLAEQLFKREGQPK